MPHPDELAQLTAEIREHFPGIRLSLISVARAEIAVDSAGAAEVRKGGDLAAGARLVCR